MKTTTCMASSGSWYVNVTSDNAALKQRVRDLTAQQRILDERLQAARSNNRFLDKRIAGLEAQLLAARAGS